MNRVNKSLNLMDIDLNLKELERIKPLKEEDVKKFETIKKELKDILEKATSLEGNLFWMLDLNDIGPNSEICDVLAIVDVTSFGFIVMSDPKTWRERSANINLYELSGEYVLRDIFEKAIRVKGEIDNFKAIVENSTLTSY